MSAPVIISKIQQRFADIDPFQHVNNIAQQSYFDVGKTDYYAAVLGEEVLLSDRRIMMVATSTSFIEQVRMHDPVRIETVCERIGTKSVTLLQRLMVGEKLCSECRATMVAFDFKTQQTIAVPEEWRHKMLGGGV